MNAHWRILGVVGVMGRDNLGPSVSFRLSSHGWVIVHAGSEADLDELLGKLAPEKCVAPLPCPKCGTDPSVRCEERTDMKHGATFMQCENCWFKGPESLYGNEDELARLWNHKVATLTAKRKCKSCGLPVKAVKSGTGLRVECSCGAAAPRGETEYDALSKWDELMGMPEESVLLLETRDPVNKPKPRPEVKDAK